MNSRYDLLRYSLAPLCGSFVFSTYLLPEACWARSNNWLSGTKTPWYGAFANFRAARLPQWPMSGSQHDITKSRGGKRHIRQVLTSLPPGFCLGKGECLCLNTWEGRTRDSPPHLHDSGSFLFMPAPWAGGLADWRWHLETVSGAHFISQLGTRIKAGAS